VTLHPTEAPTGETPNIGCLFVKSVEDTSRVEQDEVCIGTRQWQELSVLQQERFQLADRLPTEDESMHAMPGAVGLCELDPLVLTKHAHGRRSPSALPRRAVDVEHVVFLCQAPLEAPSWHRRVDSDHEGAADKRGNQVAIAASTRGLRGSTAQISGTR